jgi:hypothetical protein
MLYCKIIYAVTIALLLSGCATSNNTENNSDTGDAFMTTSEEELTGPGGLKVSCVYIARFDNIEKRRDLVGIETGIYDNQKNKIQRFPENKIIFNVKYSDWTPDTVSFLKNTVDKCVSERFLKMLFEMNNRNGYEKLSPSSAKKLIDDIYAISLATKKLDEEQAKRQQLYAIQQQNREAELQEHIKKLKRGEEKISSVSDAVIVYSPQLLKPLIVSPLLKPDNHYYTGEVIIDFQETDNLLRAKIENFWDTRNMPKLYQIAYAFLRTDKKTVNFNPESLRIGQRIKVVGRYVNNVQYKTVLGETKVSPVLQVRYMGVE